jgi:hypothetical protein
VTPLPTDAGTLTLGLWAADGHAALTATLRDWQGEAIADALALTGQPWTILAQALAQAALMGAEAVVILTNAGDLVRALSPPFAPPPPAQTQRIFYSRGEWVDVGYGGDAAHWQVLAALGGQWGGRFKAMMVGDLPKARELWQYSQSNAKQ